MHDFGIILFTFTIQPFWYC